MASKVELGDRVEALQEMSEVSGYGDFGEDLK